MAVPVALSQHRSARVNLGKNGRDIQLNRLGDQLAAPTRQKKRQFVPEGGLVLGNNALAPAKKKRRSKKSQHAEPQPQPSTAQPQPCQQLNDDGRFGFHPPFQQTVTPSTPMQPMSSHQPLHPPHISPPHLPCPSPPHPPDVSPPHPHFQVPRRSLFLDTVEPSDSEADEEAGGEDLEPEIDERSDDEDDRRAHAFLHASSNHVTMATLSQPAVSSVQGVTTTTSPRLLSRAGQEHLGFADFGADESVLQNHYNRNRPPRAPRFQPVSVTPSSHQPPVPGDTGPKPRTFEAYPPQWQQCGFPDGVEGVKEAKECLDDAVEAHLNEGGTLETGHHVDRDMSMIVFGESWQLRSHLKADIRVQVRNLKTLFPENGTQPLRPPHEIQASIRERVSRWTSDGSYLHDTVPTSGEQVHFSHPIIASTCKSFYFDRWSDISAFDRDTFQGSVPQPLVALVGTIYRNVLDEWSTGTPSTVKLESKRYVKVYKAILNSMGTVDQDDHYGPLLRQRLAAWAGFGESISSSNASADIPVNIYLNLRPPTG